MTQLQKYLINLIDSEEKEALWLTSLEKLLKILKERILNIFLKIVLKEIIAPVKEVNIEENDKKLKNKVCRALKKKNERAAMALKILVRKKERFCRGDVKKKKIASVRLESFKKKRISKENTEAILDDLATFNKDIAAEL